MKFSLLLCIASCVYSLPTATYEAALNPQHTQGIAAEKFDIKDLPIQMNNTMSLTRTGEFCTTEGTSEVPRQGALYNTKTSKTDVGEIINKPIDFFNRMLGSNSGRTSFRYHVGEYVGYMWVGTMIAPKDAQLMLLDATAALQEKGSTETVTFEATDDDPAKSFAFIVNTKNDMELVQTALKHWSEGGTWYPPNNGGRVATISESLCFYDWADRRDGGADGEAGTCLYETIKKGETASDACNVNSDAILIYNPNVDFSSLQEGDKICCSTGSKP